MSERKYLKGQARHAEAGVSETLGEIKKDFGRLINPAVWARSHPWVAVGGAVAAGFVVGAALSSSRGSSGRSVQNTAAAQPVSHEGTSTHGPQNHDRESPAPENDSHLLRELASAAFKEVLALARPVVASLITAHFAESGNNGHDGEAVANPPVTPPTP